MNRNYLYFTAFSAGMTTLAIELTASRLLGSVFGVSNLVWASIIGLILIYLTAGYFIGGFWVDRRPSPKIFYTILIWGAFTAGLAPLAARLILPAAAEAFDQLQMGVLIGSFVSVLILFSVPITLLGTISPFAIRLAMRSSTEAGRVSGRIYAISTLGSFFGTFLPVLLTIPLIGTTRTFLVFSEYLLLVALVGMWLAGGWRAVMIWIWMPVLLFVLVVFFIGRPIKRTAGMIYEGESAYNYIQVIERDGFRFLSLNEGQGIQSIYHPDRLAYYGPWMQFLAGPFFNPAPYPPEQLKSAAIVGLAAGTSARQLTAVFGPIRIDGYEIDPEIIDVGQQFFGMTMSNLNPVAEDGRLGLANSVERYQLIAVDAYRPPYIPWHLTTQEFFQIVHDHLTQDGVLVVNVGRAPGDRRLIDGLVGTISTYFPSVYVMDLPGTFNSLIYATVQPTSIEDLAKNWIYLRDRGDIHPLLIESIQQILNNLQPTPEVETVFTDELAPIEWITHNMILRFVVSGGLEELQ